MNKQKQAVFYGIAAVLFWSTAASAFKISLRYLDFLQLLFIASFVSLITTFTLLLLQKKIALIAALTKQDLFYAAGLGFLNPFLYYVVLFKAYSLLPAQQAQPLNYSWPIMLVLLSVPLLKQKISLWRLASIAICFVGIAIISTQGRIFALKFTNLYGVVLALSSAVVWAIFWISNVKQKGDVTLKLFTNFLFGFIYISIATFFFSAVPSIHAPGLLPAAYVGVFEMGITFVLWSKALSLAKATADIGRFVFLSPFLSLVFIYLLLGEKIQISSVLGLLFIVAGIVLDEIKTRTEPPPRANL